MAEFRIVSSPPPRFPGGPATYCKACRFTNEKYAWYIQLVGIKAEQPYTNSGGREVRGTADIVLCEDHARQLRDVINEADPDKRLATAKGKLLQAEAARARAEHRADVAEKALAALQDLIALKKTEKPVR